MTNKRYIIRVEVDVAVEQPNDPAARSSAEQAVRMAFQRAGIASAKLHRIGGTEIISDCCGASKGVWSCTLDAGHSGDHIAADGKGHECDRWAPDPAPVPFGFDEWETIEFPGWLKALGFEDRSYHNDACARAERYLTGYDTEQDEGPRLVVWCEHEKLEDREEGGPRFQVSHHPVDLNDDQETILYQGEDPQDCEAAIWRWFDQHPEATA